MKKSSMIGVVIVICFTVTYIAYFIADTNSTIKYQNNKIDELKQELKSMNDINKNLNDVIHKYSLRYKWYVTLTGYTNAKNETNNDNHNTAIMEKPVSGWTVAVSPDLKELLGRRVYIKGFGVRYVNDLMNSRYTKAVDIFVGDKEYAEKEIGKRNNIEMVLIEPYK